MWLSHIRAKPNLKSPVTLHVFLGCDRMQADMGGICFISLTFDLAVVIAISSTPCFPRSALLFLYLSCL